MNLFSFKKKKKETLSASEAKRQKVSMESRRKAKEEGAEANSEEISPKESGIATPKTFSTNSILLRPRITEKATDLSTDNNTFAFEVDPRATKSAIRRAFQEMYKVVPSKIRIVQIPSKTTANRRSGSTGTKSGGKKAYISLREGDSIELV